MNSKNWAQEMLKMSNTTEGKKEVINACLFVLKTLAEHPSTMDTHNMKGISGGTVGEIPQSSTPEFCP